MSAPRHTFRITLAGEPGRIIRLLRALLKRLGRAFGVRCVAIEQVTPAIETEPAKGEIRGPVRPVDERGEGKPYQNTPLRRGDSQ